MHLPVATALAALVVLLAGAASAQLGLDDVTDDLEDTVEDVGETLTGSSSPSPTATPTSSSTSSSSPSPSATPTSEPAPLPTDAADPASDDSTSESHSAEGADGPATEAFDSPKQRAERYAGGALFTATVTLAIVAIARRGFF